MGNSDASVPRLAEVKAALPNVPIARKPMLLLGLAVLVSFLRHGRTLAYPSIAAHQLRNINVTLSLPNQTDRLVLLSDYMHGVQQITMFMNKPVGSLESKWIKYGLVPLADYLSGTNFDFCSLPSNETFCYLSAKVKESSRQFEKDQYHCHSGYQGMDPSGEDWSKDVGIWSLKYTFRDPMYNKALIAAICYNETDKIQRTKPRYTKYRKDLNHLVGRVEISRPSTYYYIFELGLVHFLCCWLFLWVWMCAAFEHSRRWWHARQVQKRLARKQSDGRERNPQSLAIQVEQIDL